MKQVNFLGITFSVLDDDDVARAAEQGGVYPYIVMRIADSDPNGGSPEFRHRRLRTLCERCQELCWMDPVYFDSMRGIQVEIICTRCLAARTQKP